MVLGFRKREPAAAESEIHTSPTVAISQEDFDKDQKVNIAAVTSGSDGGDAVASGQDQLKKFAKTHQWDYNLDYDAIDAVNKIVDSGDAEKEANYEHGLLEEDSPYFEVRAGMSLIPLISYPVWNQEDRAL